MFLLLLERKGVTAGSGCGAIEAVLAHGVLPQGFPNFEEA